MKSSVAETRTGFVRNGISAAATLLGSGLLVLAAQGMAQATEAPAAPAGTTEARITVQAGAPAGTGTADLGALPAKAADALAGLIGAVVNGNHDWGLPPVDSTDGNHDWGVPPMDSVNDNHDWG
ncbi:hypothetical protein AB0D84_01190 [Streptomyces sp. NPDC048193]|uniref:hypothetical protein n=1 Tax=unclassified Streptomyces TaxID=2593676 RepID=UPI003412240A